MQRKNKYYSVISHALLVSALLVALVIGVLFPGAPPSAAQSPAPRVPPLAKQFNPAETAVLLIDFQNNFAAPDGEHYPGYKKIFEATKMLDNSVDLVKKARALGVQVIEVTEGYSPDYRELDWSNPGSFHRSQILRQAWKMDTKPVQLYEPLRPGPDDRDFLLPNRKAVSGFGGNNLDYILRARGIKNIGLGGFSSDGCVYATMISAFDLGYHVYALKDAMASNLTLLEDQLFKESYPKYSRLTTYKDFLAMISAAQVASK